MGLVHLILADWSIEWLRALAVIAAVFQIFALASIHAQLAFDLFATTQILAHDSFLSAAWQTGTGYIVDTAAVVSVTISRRTVSFAITFFANMRGRTLAMVFRLCRVHIFTYSMLELTIISGF